MSKQFKAARTALESNRDPGPLRHLFQGAKPCVFIVHGHRLASLYRNWKKTENGFIVLKICRKFRLDGPAAFAYLTNNEVKRCRS